MARLLPLRHRRRLLIFTLLGANVVSMVGDTMTLVAVPWFVSQTTSSAARTGLAGAAVPLGAGLAGFFGGPMVGWLRPRRGSLGSDETGPV